MPLPHDVFGVGWRDGLGEFIPDHPVNFHCSVPSLNTECLFSSSTQGRVPPGRWAMTRHCDQITIHRSIVTAMNWSQCEKSGFKQTVANDSNSKHGPAQHKWLSQPTASSAYVRNAITLSCQTLTSWCYQIRVLNA